MGLEFLSSSAFSLGLESAVSGFGASVICLVSEVFLSAVSDGFDSAGFESAGFDSAGFVSAGFGSAWLFSTVVDPVSS